MHKLKEFLVDILDRIAMFFLLLLIYIFKFLHFCFKMLFNCCYKSIKGPKNFLENLNKWVNIKQSLQRLSSYGSNPGSFSFKILLSETLSFFKRVVVFPVIVFVQFSYFILSCVSFILFAFVVLLRFNYLHLDSTMRGFLAKEDIQFWS